MKKLLSLLLVAALMLSMVACSSTPAATEEAPAAEAPAEEAPAEEAPAEEAPAEEAAASDLTFAIVPKSAGNPYNEREASGFEEACAALGVTSIVQYPEDTSAEAQITVINNLVAQGVDGIAVAANDAEALESTLQAARYSGIVVVTLDSDAKGSQLFVNQAGVTEVGCWFSFSYEHTAPDRIPAAPRRSQSAEECPGKPQSLSLPWQQFSSDPEAF